MIENKLNYTDWHSGMEAANNVLNIEKSDDAFAHGCCVNEYSFYICAGRAAAAGYWI